MPNKCIKTGCNVAFSSSPHHVYRCDMFIYKDVFLFKYNAPSYNPDAVIDVFILKDTVLETFPVLVAGSEEVTIKNRSIFQNLGRYYEQLFYELQLNLNY